MKKIPALVLLLILLTGCVPHEESIPSQPAMTQPADGLLQQAVQAGPGLWELELSAFSDAPSFYGLRAFGGSLLLEFVDGSLRESAPDELAHELVLVDARTGEVQGRTVTENAQIQVCGGHLALCSRDTGDITVLNDRLEKTAVFKLGLPNATSYVDAACAYAYTVTADGQLLCTDLATGKQTRLLPEGLNLYIESCIGDDLSVSCLDPSTDCYQHVSIRMSSGEMHPLPYRSGFISAQFQDGIWLSSLSVDPDSYVVGEGADLRLFSRPGMSFTMIEGPAVLFGTSYEADGSTTLAFFRQDGTAFASLHRGIQEDILSEPVWCPARNGYFFTATSPDGVSSLLFWAPQGTAEPLQMLTLEQAQELDCQSAMPRELLDRARELSRRYSLRVRIGDQCATAYGKFIARQELDPARISHGLDQLEKALAAYPRGFINQLSYSYYQGVTVQLTGKLTDEKVPENANGFKDFSAFVTDDNYTLTLVLDITREDLEQTLYHEISHLIDRKLAFHAASQPSVYSEDAWAALNPKGFSYADSVYNIPDSYYTDSFNGYFIDLYARTQPTEDRARLLEYAMSGNHWVFEGSFYAPLRRKLRFYSDAIRECFDTTGWPEVTPWEQPLQ